MYTFASCFVTIYLLLEWPPFDIFFFFASCCHEYGGCLVCCTVYCIWESLYAWKDEAYVHVYVDVDAMSMFVSCLIFSYLWAYVYLMKCMIFGMNKLQEL